MDSLREYVTEVRRAAAEPFTIQVHDPRSDALRHNYDPGLMREHLRVLAEAGVDSWVLRPPSESVEAAVTGLERFASDIF